MSCKDKWVDYVDQLNAATQLETGAADAAPRCVKPECNRPLRKDGTCVLGHAQEPAAVTAPLELEALHCLLDDLIAQGRSIPAFRKRPRLSKNNPVLLAVSKLLAQLDQQPRTASEDLFLQLADLLEPLARAADVYPWTDPRFLVTRAAVAHLRLARAQRLLDEAGSTDDVVQAQVWQLACQAYEVADFSLRTYYGDGIQDLRLPKEAAQAYALMQRLLPTLEPFGSPRHWNLALEDGLRHALDQHCNGMGFRTAIDLARSGGVWLRPNWIPGQQSSRDDDPYVFSPAAQAALAALGLRPEPAQCFLSLGDLRRLLAGPLGTVQAEVAALQPHRDRLQTPPRTPEDTVDVARTAAIPLWQEALRMERERAVLLQGLGGPGEEVSQQLHQMKIEAAAFLCGIKPVFLAQALAGMGYERRVLDLLRFKGVREALFDPDNEVDVFRHLPELAAATVVAKRACDVLTPAQWQSVASTRGAVCNPQVRKALLQVRELMGRARSQYQPGEREYDYPYLDVVAKMAKGLPPAAGATAPSDVNYALQTLQGAWRDLNFSQHFTPAAVRDLATQAGMPYARYARRGEVIDWLECQTPGEIQHTKRSYLRDLARHPRSEVEGLDSTGAMRTYRAGQRVEVVSGPEPQEAIVEGGQFLAKNPDRSGYCDEVEPTAHIILADNTKTTAPLTDLRPAPRKKGGPQ